MTRLRQTANCLASIERNQLEAALRSVDPLDRANAGLAVMTSVGFAPSSAEANRIIALRLAAPKRAEPGRIIAGQTDAGHLPLFVSADEPRLL